METNAFSTAFLARVEELDGPPSGVAAELAGPWEVVEREGRYAVVPADWPADWPPDTPQAGAVASFEQRQEALLLAALLPLLGAEPIYARLPEEEPGRVPIEVLAHPGSGAPTGTTRTPADGTVAALNLLGHLVRKPRSLALVLEASGAPALRIAGALLLARIEHEGSAARLDLDTIAEALGVPAGPTRRREVLAILREHRS